MYGHDEPAVFAADDLYKERALLIAVIQVLQAQTLRGY